MSAFSEFIRNRSEGRCAFDKGGAYKSFGGNIGVRWEATPPHDTTTFSDALSKREFGISGLCQACQDSVFGGDDE